jgi:N-acetyl-anhydromuramyl-L-alanine amidase AmpD
MQLTAYSRKLDPGNVAEWKAFQKRVAARIRTFEAAQTELVKARVLTTIKELENATTQA